MIEIKLKDIADRLGKNVSDIARDTGLNRNTVTDLFHNKVDGIKFSTIDALCETYGITLQDLVVRKDFRIGANPTSRVTRQIRSAHPFFSWPMLNALHKPSSQYFSNGVGNVYAFFVRDGAEFYFDQREANRCALAIYERYKRDDLDEAYTVFLRARDQAMAVIQGLSVSSLQQYVSTDLLKVFQRLKDAVTDVLSLSIWIDAFDFGVRDEIVRHVQKVHGFTQSEISILLASGEMTTSVGRRLAELKLAEACMDLYPAHRSHRDCETFVVEHRDAKRFLQEYPYVSSRQLAESLQVYTSHPGLLLQENEALSRLSMHHRARVKNILQAYRMRINPLAFFAKLATWRDEREEITSRIHFYIEQILCVIMKRSNLTLPHIYYLLPQELSHAQNGLVTERTLKHRYQHGLLIAFEQGDYRVHEGEQAVSVQDDLASRYLSQLAYEDIS